MAIVNMDFENMNNNNNNKNSREKGAFERLLGTPTEGKMSGLAYSAAILLPVLFAFVFSVIITVTGVTKEADFDKADWYLYAQYLITPIAFACLAGVFCTAGKVPLKSIAAKSRPQYYALAIVMQVGLWGLSQLNGIFIGFLQKFGYQPSEILLPSSDGFGVAGVIFTVAVLPAVFEEFIFRGLILKGLKGYGELNAALICGGLFALFHQNPAQTPYQFCCGFVFALVALRAGSVLPTVLSHFINNAAIIILNKFGVTALPVSASVAMYVLSAVCLIGGFLWLYLPKGKKGKADVARENAEKDAGQKDLAQKDLEARRGFFAYAAVGIGISALSWILGLF